MCYRAYSGILQEDHWLDWLECSSLLYIFTSACPWTTGKVLPTTSGVWDYPTNNGDGESDFCEGCSRTASTRNRCSSPTISKCRISCTLCGDWWPPNWSTHFTHFTSLCDNEPKAGSYSDKCPTGDLPIELRQFCRYRFVTPTVGNGGSVELVWLSGRILEFVELHHQMGCLRNESEYPITDIHTITRR